MSTKPHSSHDDPDGHAPRNPRRAGVIAQYIQDLTHAATQGAGAAAA